MLRFKLSLRAKIAAMIVTALSVATVLNYWHVRSTLIEDAAAQAGAQQETNMRVAWEVLGRYGAQFRLVVDELGSKDD